MTSYIYAKILTLGETPTWNIFSGSNALPLNDYMSVFKCWSLYIVILNYFILCCYYKLFHYTMQMHTLSFM